MGAVHLKQLLSYLVTKKAVKMRAHIFTAVLMAGLCYCTQAKNEKNIGIFNVVKFNNDPCDSNETKNGTCYTEAECENKGGKASGSCAEGYGVCCVFTQSCGDTVSQNSTYFESSAGLTGACNLRVCKCQSDIAQLRLDFMTFVLAGPSTTTVSMGELLANAPVPATKGADVSISTQCQTDTFSVSNPGGPSPPVICGTNTGAHMYVDASEACNTLSFQLGTTSSPTRSWTIKVSQYSADFSNLAPSGCTQYFFGSTTGTIQSFNWAGTHHLASQNQLICIRRERNTCQACYFATADSDFLISGADGMAAIACGHGTEGKGTVVDRVIIPGAEQMNGDAIANDSAFCGGDLNVAAGAGAASVCSKRLPFQVRFLTDNNEFMTEDTTAGTAINSKGFSIAFKLNAC